jgi:hypothetical protein
MHQPAGGFVGDGEIIVLVKDIEHVVLIVSRQVAGLRNPGW